MCGWFSITNQTNNAVGLRSSPYFSNPKEPLPEKFPVEMLNALLDKDTGELLKYQNIVNCGANPMTMNWVVSYKECQTEWKEAIPYSALTN